LDVQPKVFTFQNFPFGIIIQKWKDNFLIWCGNLKVGRGIKNLVHGMVAQVSQFFSYYILNLNLFSIILLDNISANNNV